MISLIMTLATLAYTMLEKYVFGPDRTAGQSQSIFNHTDFIRPGDKHGRRPMSIFTPLRGSSPFGQWYDKAMYYAGFDGSESDWMRWLSPGYIDIWFLSTGGRKKELLHGLIDKKENFNVGNLFELYAFFVYWHGATKAKEYIFDQIINPMFNLGLKNIGNTQTVNRFTDPSRRFFWLYDDFLKLKHIAAAPANKFNITVYTDNRKKAHALDAKPYAASLLNLLQNYPFSSGYFIDALTDPTAIMNKEIDLFTDIIVRDTQAQSNPGAPPPTQNPYNKTKAKKSQSDKYLIYGLIAFFAVAVAFIGFKIFKKLKKS